jgi:hypothetical protein
MRLREPTMGDNQNGKPKKQQMKPGTMVLLGAVTVALSIINMSMGSEAPGQALAIVQYALLAGGLVALVGGLVMMISTQK